MRDRARQRAMAEAKSHRASPQELREAGKRVKELEQELLQTVQLQPETRQGEDRIERYSRVLRLRALRDDFMSARPLQTDHPSGLVVALVMAVASFMLCGFCAGAGLVGLQALNYKPNPIDTATAFWNAVENQDYSLIHTDYLSPTLRVEYDDPTTFAVMAQTADAYYGQVTNFVLIKQQGDMVQDATLTYVVTRGSGRVAKVYQATLVMVIYAGSWGINDLGSSLDPSENNSLPPVTPTPSPTPTNTPTVLPATGAMPGYSPSD